MNSTRKSNRLNNETSPYLLQHAHNPVNWYPWGDAAFEKAREESKPVFLSIGYSTCHWCHVMAHESFEDEGVAALLNAGFVSVKVDREERPDIDEVYMSVCQAMTGGGGWPLTVLMTPEKKPFFAGTYFPKETVYGRIGMKELLTRVMTLWQTGRDDLIRQSEDISRIFTGEQGRPADGGADVSAIIRQAYGQMENAFDAYERRVFGQPEVPHAASICCSCFDYANAYHEKNAMDMTRKTLASMYRGGIFDHVGYGFSRYATDEKWLVPHFEKMLYDNALLLRAYTECLCGDGRCSSSGMWRAKLWRMCCAICARPKAGSMRPKTPIPKALKENTTFGRTMSLEEKADGNGTSASGNGLWRDRRRKLRREKHTEPA